jgi:hypothetical protein
MDKFKSANRTATKINSKNKTKTYSWLQIGQPEIQLYRLDTAKFKSTTRTATNLILQVGHGQIQVCK